MIYACCDETNKTDAILFAPKVIVAVADASPTLNIRLIFDEIVADAPAQTTLNISPVSNVPDAVGITTVWSEEVKNIKLPVSV